MCLPYSQISPKNFLIDPKKAFEGCLRKITLLGLQKTHFNLSTIMIFSLYRDGSKCMFVIIRNKRELRMYKTFHKKMIMLKRLIQHFY